MMNDTQLLRYSRQIMLPQFDVGGQEALLAARVMIVGLGGLGCPVALYLAAAGVGELVLVDDDEVELSNLQRQIAHRADSLGMHKVDSAERAVKALNPDVLVRCHRQRLDEAGLDTLLHDITLVVDATDNFDIRFALNRACHRRRLPLVSGAAIRMEGQVTVFDFRHRESPCYACLHDEGSDAALNCSQNGVMAPLVGMIGTLQAMEAVKLLAAMGRSLHGRLLVVDAMEMEHRTLGLRARPDCPVCGAGHAG